MKVGVKEEENLDKPLEKLLFHQCCGSWVDVINNDINARINAVNDYNKGVVLTSRHLRKNELFEVRLDKIVTKWIGSIEIGVTTNSPMELAFPCMINSRSDTWIMTGHGVMHNGIAFIYHYGQNLDKLQVGDRVGVMKNDSSILHFYINGEDQGDVTTLTEGVYGLINLHGQAVQATIVDVNFQKNLRFHHLHGKDARITNNGLTATRRRPLEIFNDSIEENKTLRDGGRFQISIDKMDSEQKDTIIQKYSKPENISNQQSTSVIERWNQTTGMQKNSILNSITPITNGKESLKELLALPMKPKYAFMEDDFWDSKFHNHGRNIKLVKTNSLRFDCYKIEIKSQGNDEEAPEEKFKELGNEETIVSEFKPQMVTDLDDSYLINCICFIHECCQCNIL